MTSPVCPCDTNEFINHCSSKPRAGSEYTFFRFQSEILRVPCNNGYFVTLSRKSYWKIFAPNTSLIPGCIFFCCSFQFYLLAPFPKNWSLKKGLQGPLWPSSKGFWLKHCYNLSVMWIRSTSEQLNCLLIQMWTYFIPSIVVTYLN